MCPKGKQWDAEKWLCHIRHITLTPISHIPTPGLTPLRSPSALPSESGLRLHLSPSFSPLIPTSLAPSISHATAQPSSPPHPDLAAFWHPNSQNLWLLESSSHAWWFHPEAHVPPGLLLRLACFLWLLHFYPCFPSCLFTHFSSFSPPQLPSLKFPFLKYASSLKAFIINLSRNYLRASSVVLWFIRCAVFLVSISQELSWSSFYLHS